VVGPGVLRLKMKWYGVRHEAISSCLSRLKFSPLAIWPERIAGRVSSC
jgi:hypothetical protein